MQISDASFPFSYAPPVVPSVASIGGVRYAGHLMFFHMVSMHLCN